MSNDIFSSEKKIAQKVEKLLSESEEKNNFQPLYQTLSEDYKKLLQVASHLASTNDKNKKKLAQAHKKIRDQQQTLKKEAIKHENIIKEKTKTLIETQNKLRESIENLSVTEVSNGVFWLQIPEAKLYILCGCPAEVVKHLMRRGFISTRIEGNTSYETGPNVILLSDLFVQNGNFSNLAEFPILQMLYRQGMILPNHLNNTGVKPTIIGDAKQLKAQLEYIQRGHYGLLSETELIESGVDPKLATEMMKVKYKFAFGQIKSSDELIEQIKITDQFTEIRNEVKVRRLDINKFEFSYRDESVLINLNLPHGTHYTFPYTLDYHNIPREYFAVVHSGEGDGWDIDRPSMSSIIIFQGKIYLIDAPPNITFTLEKLGIDLSEVMGLFHTHVHDDHFSGLPNLILSGHRIKYFATPMVRASAAKKLSALISMDERCFFDFFEVHDLTLDQWNICDGLEVRPLYSPHPVENNIFIFRAYDNVGAKTYAHLADVTRFTILDNMTGSGEHDVSRAFIEKIKADYLVTVNVKKIDIGGGLIHGEAIDFIDDQSNKMLMAHIARPLTNQEKEIGSAATFGLLDILIPSDQYFLRRKAFYNLRSIFPHISVNQFDPLLIAPIVQINPGSIICHKNQCNEYIDMILTGVVEYIHGEKDISYTLSNGSLIGEQALFSNKITGTWRALSHVNIMRFSIQAVHSFLNKTKLKRIFEKKSKIINFLLTTWLFGEKLSFAVLSKIATATQVIHLLAGEELKIDSKDSLFLIKSGSLVFCKNQLLYEGDFVGEKNFLQNTKMTPIYFANEKTALYVMKGISLEEIPIIYWKILETANKRNLMGTLSSGTE